VNPYDKKAAAYMKIWGYAPWARVSETLEKQELDPQSGWWCTFSKPKSKLQP